VQPGASSGDTTPPSVPTSLSASAVSSSAINLTWTASTDNVGVTGYKIYRGGTQVGTSATNSYSDTGLTASTQYTYTVSAYDAAGNNSAQSSSASATTQAASGDTTPPTVPTNLSASAISSSAINLTWTASTDNVGVTGYNIYRGGSLIATSSLTSYFNTGLTASTQYTYTVSAYDAAGNNSAQSSSASATTQASGGGGSITIGETTVLPNADSGNANLLIGQNATLSQTATIQSLSFYATAAAGNLRLGIYDATGPSGGPGTLKAQTNSFVTTTGWNTAPVITPVSLPAGTYWLTYLPDNNGLSFVKNSVSGTSGLFYNYTFGPMPATFSTTPQTTGSHWSLYATLSVP
jgi:chitodextrinase